MDKKQAIASWTSILSEENIITTDTVLEKKRKPPHI